MLWTRPISANIHSIFQQHVRRLTTHKATESSYMSLDSAAALPFSIYIHWPYCESKCTYCNFNKYVNPAAPPHERMLSALKKELAFYLKHPKFALQNRKVHSVYFGGGTPTLAPVSVINSVLGEIDKLTGGLPAGLEVTIEGNPTSSEMAKLQSLHETGITRLSLGVQSLCEDDLPILGRDHSAADAIRAIDIAKRIFGDRGFTFDMIFGRPGQSYKDWSKEIDQALSIAGDHISIYQLTLERGTPLFRDVMAGKVASIADTEEIEDMYEHTIEKTASLGFCHYEVSNYAKTRNAISRHNFSYWRGMDYIGIGPGAHGRLTDVHGNRLRTFGEFHPERWMAQCETEGDGVRKMIPMQAHQIPEELVLFGLRTKLGIPRSRFAQMTNNSQLDSILESHSLQSYIDLGLLVDDPAGQCYAKHDIPLYVPHDCVEELAQGAIRPTEKGLAVIDSIIPKILQIV